MSNASGAHNPVTRSVDGRPAPAPFAAAPANPRFPVRTSRIATWLEAEKIAATWMQAFGFVTAQPTPGGADLGVDARAPQVAIAQVKKQQAAIGRPLIQLLVGSRHPAMQEKMLFFSRSAYRETATQWADIWDVALFRFDDFGNPFPENKAARRLCRAAGYGSWQNMTPPSDRWVSQDTALLRRELILSTTGKPVRTSRSAIVGIREWATACGYTDAIALDGELELITAKGLIILARFSGLSVNALEIGKVAYYPGERIRVAVSWVNFSKGARRAAQQRSVALLRCAAGGALEDVNDIAAQLFAN